MTPTKNTDSAIYSRRPPPATTDPTALLLYVTQELLRLQTVSRRTDERLKAGSL